jgi:hypothetical protein
MQKAYLFGRLCFIAWRLLTLPGPCGPSTISVRGLNGRVRDGNEWNPSAMVTRRIMLEKVWVTLSKSDRKRWMLLVPKGTVTLPASKMRSCVCRRSPRPIRICQLNTLLCLHLRPIYLVIYKGSYLLRGSGKSHLEGGFALRCFQRLSRPYLATQRCSWRNNWYTSGTSIPVLSY